MAHHGKAAVVSLSDAIAASLLNRNAVSRSFFDREADRLARACRDAADRFARGGRLLAFGVGPQMTDAQHVSVEFVHPVIVGKRALPALDLSACPRAVDALAGPDDIVMGFGPPSGDRGVASVLRAAREAGAQTFALPGIEGDYSVKAPSHDPFVHQEIVEVLYHTLWETVHVFLERREAGHDVGASAFLYPYLGKDPQGTESIVGVVASSICAKARTDERLRAEVARTSAERIRQAAVSIRERIDAGGSIVAFGNGGSATDANDFVIDCAVPEKPYPPIRAISIAMEPANLSAIVNDVGRDAMFLRQLIAHGRKGDIAFAISTSGGSSNVIVALEEARKRGMLTVALLGYDGGEIVRRGLADVALVVPCDYIPRIQEIQASIYHTLIDAIHACCDHD
jgi:D-sedoheptulose 7-phosphate isomerase